MKYRSYLNHMDEPLYVLHFPGTGLEIGQSIVDENLDRSIVISDKLSIISIMNRQCWDSSPVRMQCEHNSIPLYNTAISETHWSNTLKISHILKSLELVNTQYVLIVDGRDVTFVNDLDNKFIQTFESFNCPIIYNGTPVAYPEVAIEPLHEILSHKGKQKFLNAGVCIGDRKALIEFYTVAYQIHLNNPGNKSEQLIIRKARQKHPNLASFDEYNKLFRIVHKYDTIVQENSQYVKLI